jgi:hypothetical protein
LSRDRLKEKLSEAVVYASSRGCSDYTIALIRTVYL